MDELMLRQAQKGDAQAFEALITPYEQMVWRVCWHYTNHTENARDCAQEAMLKAWRSIAAYRGDCSLESWLYRICASVCLDFLRKSKRHDAESTDAMREEGFDPAADAPPPAQAVEQKQSRQALRQAMARLPEDMRTALILYALEKKRYEEIASITGAAVGTVKSRINRARQKLEEMLRNGEPSGKSAVQHREGRKGK